VCGVRERRRTAQRGMAFVARRRARDRSAGRQAGAHRYVGDLVQELPDDGQDDVAERGCPVGAGGIRQGEIPSRGSRFAAGEAADAAVRRGRSARLCHPEAQKARNIVKSGLHDRDRAGRAAPDAGAAAALRSHRRHVPDSRGRAADRPAASPHAVLLAAHHPGYLEQSLSNRIGNDHQGVAQFFGSFHALFPPNAEYKHDKMELRTELTDAQKKIEPKNADSHLTFMGAGVRNGVTYTTQPGSPVYFIELDGKSEAMQRRRRTTIVAYDEEREVAHASVTIPMSKHPIDSVNLADPRFGIIDQCNDLLARCCLARGRVDLMIEPSEPNAGLTVNEYETLLMTHDLVEVLRNPLHFAKIKAHNLLDDPLSIPGKTLSYAKYDVVRLMNSLMEALRLDQSTIERLIAKVMSVPARRFMRSRRVSFLAATDEKKPTARIVRGTYQSPILVQWQPAAAQSRKLNISIVELS